MSHSDLLTSTTPQYEDEGHSSVLVSKQDDVPRLIVSESGEIIFHTPSFSEICNTQHSLIQKKFDTIFSLRNHKGDLTDGQYDFALKQGNEPISLALNWVNLPDGRRYMVASVLSIPQENTATAGENLRQYVADKIQEKQNTAIESSHFQDLSPDCLCTLSTHGHLVSTNPKMEKTFALHKDDTKQKSFTDLVYTEDKNLALSAFKELSNARDTSPKAAYTNVMLRHITSSQEVIYIQWHFKAEHEKVYALGQNITRQVIQKETIKRHKRELNEAEAIAHMGHWRWPVGSQSLELSDEIYRIFGVNRGEFTPTLDNVNDMIHEDDSGRMLQVFERAIIEQKDYDMDFRLNGHDTKTRYIRCEGRCDTDAEGDVIALYGIMQDITDIMKREQDLRQAKESVERAYTAKTQFLANMSHELRTPLNAIIGFSEMMKQQLLGPIGTEKYLEYIDGILESGEHLLDLISDILDMSKIEAGKYELSVEKFNLSKIVRLAVHMMEGRAIDAHLKLHIDLCDEDCQIVADRRAVMQVILNILSNAIKFSKEAGTISITLTKNDGHYQLDIEDQGIGIPSDKIEDITKPFEQAENDYTREYEGSGLGLAITKELVELHGGKLSIHSQLGMGTVVSITLPDQLPSIF
ncbi:MAG: ATP-binding protein [Alphaproteobacteria bacterium]|nr:ATP-binding protein [Alphaproteobacteria bacterium]